MIWAICAVDMDDVMGVDVGAVSSADKHVGPQGAEFELGHLARQGIDGEARWQDAQEPASSATDGLYA